VFKKKVKRAAPTPLTQTVTQLSLPLGPPAQTVLPAPKPLARRHRLQSAKRAPPPESLPVTPSTCAHPTWRLHSKIQDVRESASKPPITWSQPYVLQREDSPPEHPLLDYVLTSNQES